MPAHSGTVPTQFYKGVSTYRGIVRLPGGCQRALSQTLQQPR